MELNKKPGDDFAVNTLEPLLDSDVTGSKEFWMIQWPISHCPEINGSSLKVKLDKDGVLGGFEDSSGKEFDLVSFASQDVDATVIIPSGEESESEIVGTISRRVSLVRHPEPKELLETMKPRSQKLVGAVTDSSGKYSKSALSSRHKSGQSVLHSASTRSSRPKSVFSGFTETPKSSKRKKDSESSSSKHRSSTSMVSGSLERSEKSKKRVKIET